MGAFLSTSACHAAQEKLSHVLFLQKDQCWHIFARMISTTLLEGENAGAEDPVVTLAIFHLGSLQSGSSLFLYLRCLLTFAAHQVCPGVLSFRLVLHMTGKFIGAKAVPKHSKHEQFKNLISEQKANWTQACSWLTCYTLARVGRGPDAKDFLINIWNFVTLKNFLCNNHDWVETNVKESVKSSLMSRVKCTESSPPV